MRQEATKNLVMYGSTQTHSIGTKSALLLGMPFRTLPVKAEDGYALRGDVLKAAIEEDIKKGFTPFFVSELSTFVQGRRYATPWETEDGIISVEQFANTQSARSVPPRQAPSTTLPRLARS